jgi:transposase
MLDRLELVLDQIAELERQRDAVLNEKDQIRAAEMIQQLASLRGIGVQSATVLVREGFVREFANGKRSALTPDLRPRRTAAAA